MFLFFPDFDRKNFGCCSQNIILRVRRNFLGDIFFDEIGTLVFFPAKRHQKDNFLDDVEKLRSTCPGEHFGKNICLKILFFSDFERTIFCW